MRLTIGLLVLAASTLFSAGPDFNGRWDITVDNGRACWLELTGVGSSPAGKFVSVYGGQMNNIDSISVENGELRFMIIQPGTEGAPARRSVYKARLAGQQLAGTLEVEGRDTPPVKWTGTRAPVITDQDDGTWKEGQPINLFNGKDLTGWKPLSAGSQMKWTVENGILRNAPPTTDIVSQQSFWNFKLHVDFRIVADSNSGIGLRGRYEIQIIDDYGKPPEAHGAAALYGRIAPSVNASKPPGEWQSYDIRLVGRTLTVVHNGKKVIDKAEVEGLTAIANNSDEAKPGPFIVQGDHSYVEIKSFVVTPLVH